jgi:hypothetical protein
MRGDGYAARLAVETSSELTLEVFRCGNSVTELHVTALPAVGERLFAASDLWWGKLQEPH